MTRFKGGVYEWRTITDQETIEAVHRYLRITKREKTIGDENRALWVRFDNGAKSAALKNEEESTIEPRFTSASYNKQIKKYAREAGIGHFHIHQFRHTVARIIAEEVGILETQEALGHSDLETMRVYVKRIEFKKDKHSQRISARRIKDLEATKDEEDI